MADSAAAELADSLIIRDRPEAMQQDSGELLRVEDGQSARGVAPADAPALTAIQQHFSDRIDKTSDQYIPEEIEAPALTAAQQKALEQIPITLKTPVVAPGLTRKWKKQFESYIAKYNGTAQMTFHTFATHMERQEKVAHNLCGIKHRNCSLHRKRQQQ